MLNSKWESEIEKIEQDEVPKKQGLCLKQIKKVFRRQVKSTQVQRSGVMILNFLINDMLDYASISANKFRSFAKKFDLKESIQEMVDVMKFKAKELGIKV